MRIPKYLYGLFLSLCFVVSCSEAEGIQEANYIESGQTITIEAAQEGYASETRTIRQEDGSVFWNPGDEISLFFMGGTNGGNKFTSQNTEVAEIAEFAGTINGITGGGESLSGDAYFWAIYPYSKENSCENNSVITVLPNTQQGIEESFADDLFITIARSTGVKMGFKNLCGGLKFCVSQSGISSISFRGNKEEVLAGKVRAGFNASNVPVVTEVLDGKTEVTLVAPNGGEFEVGKFYYAVLLPATLSEGFTMTFHKKSDKTCGVYTYNKSVTFKRSTFGTVRNLDNGLTFNEESDSSDTIVGSGESGIYLGIMGFNQRLYSYPIRELTTDSKAGFDSFIDDMGIKNGTLLYYSVDEAITTMQSSSLPADVSTVAIVTFTDGLDQGSIMMNGSYSDNTEYLNAVNHRIMNETVSGQSITAYSIGIRGQDVADVTMFQNNLKKLASKDEYATEVTSMAEVNEKFKEIAETLSTSNYVQTITLKMPGLPNGTLVRFTFDNVNTAEKSDLYIEGTFNLTARSLENVKYHGLESSSGTTIKGVVDGIFVGFTFEGVHTENNILIDNQFIDEWIYVASNSVWQINSEFDKTENSDIITERSSAAIMLVLDCSSSLGSDFPQAQSNAKDFINTLFEAVGGDSGSGENIDNTIYSTTPKDLTLAIWKDGKRYYLTKEEYGKANLSDAVIEGLAIVAGGESFILSLRDVQWNCITNTATANKLYGDILPTAEQGIIISAKCIDINSAIRSFGGTALSIGSYCYGYYTKSTEKNNNDYFTNCIELYNSSHYGTLGSTDSPYIRGVRPTNYDSAIYWKDPNDLKLSVLINGVREFLTKDEYEARKSEISTIEGVVIIAGGEKFAIHLNDAHNGALSYVDTANMLYGDILPTAEQGIIISAKHDDINSAIRSFGGTALSIGSYCDGYYTKSTEKNNNGDFTNCIFLRHFLYYGTLKSISMAPYIRGVTNIE